MGQEFTLQGAMADILTSMSTALADFFPRALTALVVFLLGLLLAKLVEKAIRNAFDKFKIDDVLRRFGLTEILEKVGLRQSPGQLLSRLVFYLLLLLFTQSASRAVGLTPIADAVTAFFGYLPNLVAAFLVLIIGLTVAQFASGAVTRAARDSGVEFAPVLGRSVSTIILFVVTVMATTQLNIDTEVVRSTVLVVLCGFALALALSFGLGTRDITRNLVAGFYARKIFAVGETIEISGHVGVLAGISSLQVLIEQDGHLVAVPNSVFLDEAVRQSGRQPSRD